LSVDPLVDQTGQPYVFTNDDPLNATDPLGTVYAALMGGGSQTLQQEAATLNKIFQQEAKGGDSGANVSFATVTKNGNSESLVSFIIPKNPLAAPNGVFVTLLATATKNPNSPPSGSSTSGLSKTGSVIVGSGAFTAGSGLAMIEVGGAIDSTSLGGVLVLAGEGAVAVGGLGVVVGLGVLLYSAFW
jgi:hypothetical protein